MNLIAAADENWGIGKNGGLLAHISGDMKYFRETTKGKVVVMVFIPENLVSLQVEVTKRV